MPERSGEESLSMRDKLGWAGRLAFQGTRVASELGDRLVLANLPSLFLGCWSFLLMQKGARRKVR
jgi:hypothetical protein